MSTAFSDLIKTEREKLALTHPHSFHTYTMAVKFGMSGNDYTAIENGTIKPSLAIALKIGIALGISMHDTKVTFDKS